MKFWCLLSRDHRKTGLLDLLRVTNLSSAVNSTTPLDFRASGKRFVRCRIGFTCCKEGFEDNLEKLEEAGFPHMQTQGGTCLPSGTSPHADADAGSFREFRRERSGILEPITLVSPARQRQSGRDEQPFFVGDITGVGSTHGKSVTRGSPVVPPVVLRRAGWSMPKPCFRNPQTRNPAH